MLISIYVENLDIDFFDYIYKISINSGHMSKN